jgi:hypothetical protein
LWTAIDRLRSIFTGASPTTAPTSFRLLKEFPDGSRIEFGRGNFDEWCVYVTRPSQPRTAPLDTEYFSTLRELHVQFPRLHDDFVEVFERTTAEAEVGLLTRISEIASQYPPPARTEIDILLTTLCAAMIAEENRAHAPLGKRIKRLGVHQVLVEKMPVEEAAVFSRGKPWRELEKLCQARGF